MRHLATGDLWVQQLVKKRGVILEKWPTQTNPADLLTKGLARPKIQSLLQIMMIQAQGGRPSAAPVRDQTVPRMGPIAFEPDGANFDTEAP